MSGRHSQGTPVLDLEELRREKAKLFISLVYSVWLILLVYVAMYFILKAKLAFISVTLGVFIFSPLTLFLEKKGFTVTARGMFIMCCNFYVYVCSLSLMHRIAAEYYYIPATMIPLLVFEISQIGAIAGGIAVPLLMWILTKTLGWEFLNTEWLSNTDAFKLIAIINFLGAFLITLMFLHIFRKYMFSLQDLVVRKQLEKSENLVRMNDLLQQQTHFLKEAQRIAKLGNWSYQVLSKKMNWSEQMFLIFQRNLNDGEPTIEAYRLLLHSDDVAVWDKAIAQCTLDGSSFVIRFRVTTGEVNASEKFKWVEARGQAQIGSEGTAYEISGTTQDISEEVRLQDLIAQERARLVQRDKLATLGEMAAGVAHEINNPLAIIDGSAQLLMKCLDYVSKVEMRVDIIKKSVIRIAKIVNGLRKFSRSTEKKEEKRCFVEPILSEVMNLVKSKSDQYEVQIILELESEAAFLFDELEIEQVLVNLVINGIDAAKEKVEKWVRVRARDEDNQVVIQVVDSGVGIPKEVLEKIFNPFFTTKKVGEGTGLGLSIAKGIIESNGGTLEFIEESSHTCFEVRIAKAKNE